MSASTRSSRRKAEGTRADKVQERHLQRLAVVYVRQSTAHQVQHNQESTRLQYSLSATATQMGWPADRVLVIDDDLGVSGASADNRVGFQRLLSEVALDNVGIVLGTEISRLARSCKDWYQLLELCALRATLIRDQDGLYDPATYNDRLLLGLKGTISEAELHIIRQRNQQGRLQKARRGELSVSLPIGYVRRPSGEVILDPDEQARAVVKLVFEQFERLGSLAGVLKYFAQHGVQFGVRLNRGPKKGDLEWRRPNHQTIANMLTHPIYAGAYVYGRRECEPSPARNKIRRWSRDPNDWEVCLRDHLPAYISWEQYEQNIAQIERNRSTMNTWGVARDGGALLAGLATCSLCGTRMATAYPGPGKSGRYSCLHNRTLYGGDACQSLSNRPVDQEISRLVLKALEPSALDVSMKVSEDIEQERTRREEQWRLRLERARYEVERAERQYQAVEPENRLVARTLETTWEEKLHELRELEEEHKRFLQKQPRTMTEEEREQIRALAADLPSLWTADTTTDRDRKAIVREIIEKVEITVEGNSEWVELLIHWVGGHQTYTRIRRRVTSFEQLSNFDEILEHVDELRRDWISAPKIASALNSKGFRPTDPERPFSAEMVRQLLSRRQISKSNGQPTAEGLRAHEWFVPDLAREIDIPYSTMLSWVRSGRVKARKKGAPGRWVISAEVDEVARLRASRRKFSLTR